MIVIAQNKFIVCAWWNWMSIYYKDAWTVELIESRKVDEEDSIIVQAMNLLKEYVEMAE